jgi:GAF domain-containing protein
MNEPTGQHEHPQIAFLHEIGERLAASDPLRLVLGRIVEFIAEALRSDSCFIYTLENGELILRASKNPHAEVIDRLRLRVGQGITGWVAEHNKPVAIARNAFEDPRFLAFTELPEDRYEAFLSVPILYRDRLTGVINLQHREPYAYAEREIQLIATVGFLVGTEIETARIEAEQIKLADLPGARRLVEQAALILGRDLGCDREQAHRAMQKQSRSSGKAMKEIASAVLLHDELRKGSSRSPASAEEVNEKLPLADQFVQFTFDVIQDATGADAEQAWPEPRLAEFLSD